MRPSLYKQYKKAFAEIKRFVGNEKSKKAGFVISENFYVIHKAYHLSEKKFLTKKRLYNEIRRYLGRNGWSFSSEHFFECFGSFSLSVSDVYALETLFYCALIISVYEETVLIKQGQKHKDAKLVSSVLSVRKIKELNLEECFSRLCPAEKYLTDNTPLYSRNNVESKNRCREELMRYSGKCRLTDIEAIKRLEAKGKSVYDLTVSDSRLPFCFFTVYFLIFIILAVCSSVLFKWLAFFTFLPLYVTSGMVCDKLFASIIKSKPPLRLELNSIPKHSSVLAVTVTLLFGEKADKEIFDNLESFYLRNKSENTYFAVLADFPDAKKQSLESDAYTAEYAVKRIKKLNETYGNVFGLFLRSRSFNERDGVWGGRERKRGAVCDLVNAVTEGSYTFAYSVNTSFLKNIRYILTLDGDTSLPMEGIKELAGIMLHPFNSPVVREGRVVRGYGILQPKIRTGLKPSYSTYYSLLRSDEGGFYERASFDRYQCVLGSGVFCGKGMFDADLFKKLVIPAFPEKAILSHDIPEGCILRCMYVPDVAFTDSSPRSTVSSFTRLHRWIRGDIQNSIFLKSPIIKADGKYKLAENIIRHLTPVFSAFGMLTSAFLPHQSRFAVFLLFVLLQSYNVFPAVNGVISMLFHRSYTPRRFFSIMFTSVFKTVSNLLLEFASVFEYAYRAADATLKSAWRMLFSKRKLLQWTAFSQTDSKSNEVLYHIASLPASVLSGCILLCVSPYSVYRLFGLITFVYPLVSYFLSAEIPKKTSELGNEQREKLTKWAKDSYKFFRERVSRKTNYLPPDNVQLSPSDKVAERTSPTNIGLYLLSTVASHDFGFITEDEMLDRISETMGTVERLEKWNGHLYNWYDTENLNVIGERYVSTVDSGNFVTMLILLSQALKESDKGLELAEKVYGIAREADFSLLYNKTKNLFYLGCSDKNGYDKICYDMLMSEIRTTCYYACAYGITPKKHWLSLSREVVAKNGFIGMVSWSGSAFEYFMPELFLPSKQYSFIDESLGFAFYNQRSFKKDRLWGVSESGYYAFDSDMNYQYRANGVPALALKKYREGEKVVSPYSSFLMLERDYSSVVKNLENLEKAGVYGEYGFYEAIDLSSSESGVVCSYMSHHVGMSIVAAANACFDGIFRKRFFKDRQIASAEELLCEKIPTNVHLFPKPEAIPKPNRIYSLNQADNENYSLVHPNACVSYRNNLSLISSSDGRIMLRHGNYLLNDAEFSAFSSSTGLIFGFSDGKEYHTCRPCRQNRFSYEKYSDGFAFVSSEPHYPCVLRGRVASDGKCFVFDMKADESKKYGFCLYFRPVLESLDKYGSHPAYSKLFVVSHYDSNEKIIFFRRNGKVRSERYPVCAVALENKETDFVFRTDEEHLKSHSRPNDGSIFDIDFDCKTGVCINPACIIKTSCSENGSIGFIISSAYTEEECVKAISFRRKNRKAKQKPLILSAESSEIISNVFFTENKIMPVMYDTSVLWKAGVSGDFPLITLNVFDESITSVSNALSAFKSLTSGFVKCEMLFLTNEQVGYFSPLSAFVRDLIAEHCCESFVGRKGGVFIVNSSVFDKNELEFIKAFSAYYGETDMAAVKDTEDYENVDIIRGKEARLDYKITRDSVSISGTPFLPNSYIIAGYSLGSVLTEKTLGFTFSGNASQGRISRFYPDPFEKCYGEELIAVIDGKAIDIISCSDKVIYKNGIAEYSGFLAGREYKVKVFVFPKLPIKAIWADFGESSISCVLCVAPHERSFIKIDRNAVFFKGMKYSPYGKVNFVCACENGKYGSDRRFALTGKKSSSASHAIASSTGRSSIFFIGSAPTLKSAESIISMLNKNSTEKALAEAEGLALSFIPKISLFSYDGRIDSLYSVFSPYQTAYSRFIAKTGFYQLGGAYGFRDQLQDCLCLVYSRPDTVRTHIIRAAFHQYREGDVMHWWTQTNGKQNGIRSMCSDDLLFLPLTACDYAEKTGDMSVFDVSVPYLVSPELNKPERYETPEISQNKENVYLHCLRAIFRASSKKGENGLCLMGSCDWNDGFSSIGVSGKGESVFTTLLLAYVCREFADICRARNDKNGEQQLIGIYCESVKNVEKLFSHDRFPRGTFDSGELFGVSSSSECEIDIISQCFSAVVMGKTPQTVKAMNTAYDMLFDKEKKILKLFSPPFEKTDAGYISDYPKGIRENGGQYTHGALWGVWGLAVCGEYEKAVEIMNCIAPTAHSYSNAEREIYKLEPYVMEADIYSSGRGGWSWYTGSAAWYYKIMTEIVLGIRLKNDFGSVAITEPLIEYTVIIDKDGKKLKIIADSDEHSQTLDGKEIAFPLTVPEGEHVLRVKAKKP